MCCYAKEGSGLTISGVPLHLSGWLQPQLGLTGATCSGTTSARNRLPQPINLRSDPPVFGSSVPAFNDALLQRYLVTHWPFASLLRGWLLLGQPPVHTVGRVGFEPTTSRGRLDLQSSAVHHLCSLPMTTQRPAGAERVELSPQVLETRGLPPSLRPCTRTSAQRLGGDGRNRTCTCLCACLDVPLARYERASGKFSLRFF